MIHRIVVLAALIVATQSVPAVVFHSIDAIQSSTQATDLYPVSNLIQGPGVGFDANAPHDKILSGAAGNWATADPGGFPSDYIAVAGMPVLTIDLGKDVLLTEISVWGSNSLNANGVSEFSLRFATETEGVGGFGTSIGFNPFYFPVSDDTLRQSFAFGQSLVARYVEFTARDNLFVSPGDGSTGGLPGGDRLSLGEVAFAASVPEPASLVLIGLGIAGITYRRNQVKVA